MRFKFMLVLALVGSLGACASGYENRIERRLVDLGLSRTLSSCMASRMVDNLSSGELRRVARFADALDRDVEDLTLGQVAARFGGVGDAHIIEVMGRAAVGCAISG